LDLLVTLSPLDLPFDGDVPAARSPSTPFNAPARRALIPTDEAGSISDDDPGMSVRMEEAGGETWRARLTTVPPVFEVELRKLWDEAKVE